MPDNTINWGQGAVNNSNDWGKAKANSSNSFGAIYDASPSGDTNIVGGDITAVSITYPNSAYCGDASDPTPTITDNVGAGTFSSTAGLVFVSTTTGEVDLSASTTGATYVITYTDTDSATATFNFTINAYDDASFSYSSSNYMQSFPDPTPTITGVTGGAFSGSAGLVINSTTGEIDLDASTIATHTITYDTASSGSSVCANTSTQTVGITAALAQVNNVYSMNFDGTNDFIDVGNDSSLSPTSQLSVSAWVNNTGTGTGSFPCIISNVSSSSNNGGFALAKNSNKWKFYLDTTGSSGWATAESNGTVVSNSWQHLCVTWDGSTVIMYLNGQAQTTTASASQIVYNADTETIIGEYAASYFQGKLDEISIFNVALTAQEVKSIYYATETGKTADLNDLTTPPIKWYRMGD
jgi:hypothetical protein